MSSSAILQNSRNERLTIVSAQPNAIANLLPNQVDIILDRAVSTSFKYDESKYFGRVTSGIQLFFERTEGNISFGDVAKHTLPAHAAVLRSLYQPSRLIGEGNLSHQAERPAWSALKSPLSPDVHIVAMRTSTQRIDYGGNPVSTPARFTASEERRATSGTDFALILHKMAANEHDLNDTSSLVSQVS